MTEDLEGLIAKIHHDTTSWSSPCLVHLGAWMNRDTRSNGIKAILQAYLYDDAQHTGSIVNMPVFLMKISEAAARKSTVKWGRDLDYSEITIVSLDFTNAVRWTWASTLTDNSGLATEGESRREAHLSPDALTTFFCAPLHPPSRLSLRFFSFHPPSSNQATRQISYPPHLSFCPSEVWHPPPSFTRSRHHDFSFHCIHYCTPYHLPDW